MCRFLKSTGRGTFSVLGVKVPTDTSFWNTDQAIKSEEMVFLEGNIKGMC